METESRSEREELAREMETADPDRDRLRAELHAARARAEDECQAKTSALQELARVREELENERQKRDGEAEVREKGGQKALQRDEAARNQLGDITNSGRDQCNECGRKKELTDERRAEQQTRMDDNDSKLQDLHDMVARIIEDREVEKIRAEEERLTIEGKPGRTHNFWCVGMTANIYIDTEKLLEELQMQNAEQRELLSNLSESESCSQFNAKNIS